MSLNSLQQVPGPVPSACAPGTGTTPAGCSQGCRHLPAIRAGSPRMVWPPSLPAPSALLGCPYSVRLGGEESGFLLCPGPCSGSCEHDIGAEAMLDVPGGGISGCWDFWLLGFLGAGQAEDQNCHSRLEHGAADGSIPGESITLQRTQPFPVQSSSSTGGSLESGVSSSHTGYHSCIKTSELSCPQSNQIPSCPARVCFASASCFSSLF